MSDESIDAKTKKGKPRQVRRQRWKGSQEQMSMPEAMRVVGLGEPEVAFQLDKLVTVVVNSPNDKLRFEVLRDCAKLLGAFPPNQEVPGEAGPQIILDLPRPLREPVPVASPESPEPPKTNTLAVSPSSR
jgi:hypothetical protein